MRYAFLAIAALAACTDEVSVPSGVCGNYVLEAGEDCDKPGLTCTSTCRIVCDPGARATPCASAGAFDGSCCPSGMICGVDTVCHAPTGTVSSTELVSQFLDQTWIVTDINGDLMADVMGNTTSAAEVRYGDLSTPLANIVTVRAPPEEPHSQVGYGDFSGDGRTDIVIPTSTGLFAFDTTGGVPEPVAFPVTATPGIVHERIAPAVNLGALYSSIVRLDYVPGHAAGDSNFQLSVVTLPSLLAQSFAVSDTQPSLCGVTANIAPDQVLRGRAIHAFLDHNTLRVPLVIGSAAVGICVATANPHNTNTPDVSYAIPRAVWGTYHPFVGDGETFFANLTGAACPDLVVTALDPMANEFSMILKGTGTAGTDSCRVDTLPADAMFVPGRPLAAIAVAALLGTNPGLVTSKGIFETFTPTAAPVTMATRNWRYAEVIDINGDGLQDAVLLGSSNDVEVLRQRPWNVGPQWSDYVIPTTDPVALVTVGNFDGDRAGDVAFATIDPSVANAPADLSIAWGDIDDTFEVESVGSFAAATSFTGVDLLDTSLPPGVDQCTDLLIARGGAGLSADDPALLIAEYGSTSRTMSAPLTFSSFGSVLVRGAGIMAEIGHFGANQSVGVAALFGINIDAGATAGTSAVTAFVDLTTEPYGAFTPTAAGGAVPSCGPPDASGDAPFCVTNAHFLTMHRNSGDLLLAMRGDVDGGSQSQCVEYYVSGMFVSGTTMPGLTPMSCSALAPSAAGSSDPDTKAAFNGLTGASTIHLADNDGTTAHLLVVNPALHTGQAFLWTLTVNGSSQPQLDSPIALDSELAASGALPAGASAHCMDGIEAELGHRKVNGTTYGAGVPELVLACSVGSGTAWRSELWARYAAPSDGPPHYAMLWDTGLDDLLRLRTGDINGDGLNDLLYSEGTAFRQRLHALLQCDAHQSGCKGGQ
jgi:hypothetical protein